MNQAKARHELSHILTLIAIIDWEVENYERFIGGIKEIQRSKVLKGECDEFHENIFPRYKKAFKRAEGLINELLPTAPKGRYDPEEFKGDPDQIINEHYKNGRTDATDNK